MDVDEKQLGRGGGATGGIASQRQMISHRRHTGPDDGGSYLALSGSLEFGEVPTGSVRTGYCLGIQFFTQCLLPTLQVPVLQVETD